MSRTSMKVSDDTYNMVVKTRGLFEQLFKRKLSLDETIYLASRLISFTYETVQRLNAQDKIKIVESKVGSLKIEGFDDVSPEVLPEVIDEFTEINDKLTDKKKKEKKDTRLVVITQKTGGK